MTMLFVSHSRHDNVFIDHFEKRLHGKRYDVWIDRNVILGGTDWWQEIKTAIRRCDAVILVLSSGACASKHVKQEIEYAQSLHKSIVPIVIETDCPRVAGLWDAGQIEPLDFSDVDLSEPAHHLTKSALSALTIHLPNSISRDLTALEKRNFSDLFEIYRVIDKNNILPYSRISEKADELLISYKLDKDGLANTLKPKRLRIPIAWIVALVYALKELNPNFTKQDGLALGRKAFLSPTDLEKISHLFSAKVNDGAFSKFMDFLGRGNDLNETLEVLQHDQVRLIHINGFAGIGKTTLAIQLVEHSLYEFDYIYWIDFYYATSIQTVLESAIRFISEDIENTDGLTEDEVIDRLINTFVDLLYKHKCLIILDNFEQLTIDQSRYKPGFENYSTLITRLVQSNFSSKVVITSRYAVPDFAVLQASRKNRIFHKELEDLSQNGIRQMLSFEDIEATDEEIEKLASLTGNPLALSFIIQKIKSDYSKSVGTYLTIYADPVSLPLSTFIEEAIVSLSPFETELLYWMAINGIWVNEDDLMEIRFKSISHTRTLLKQAIDVLKNGYKLIEETQDNTQLFRTKFVIYEHVIQRFVRQVCQDIHQGDIRYLSYYPILQASAQEHVMKQQRDNILLPLRQNLEPWSETVPKIKDILAQVQHPSALIENYVAGNCLNLLISMGVDLTNYDFSNMVIWEADLRNVTLHNVSFKNSQLRHCRFSKPFSNVFGLAVNPEGTLLVAAMIRGVTVWQIDGFRELWSKEDIFPTWIFSTFFTPDGQHIVCIDVHHRVSIFKTSSGQLVNHYQTAEERYWDFAYNATHNVILMGGHDRAIKMVDLPTGNILGKFQHDEEVIWAVANRDNVMLSGGSDKAIKVWDIAKVELVAEIKQAHAYNIWSLAISPDGRYFASGDEGYLEKGIKATIHLWDLETLERIHTWTEHTDTIFDLVFSADSRLLFSGSADSDIRVWNLARKQCIAIFKGHKGWVRTLCLNPQNPDVLFSGSNDRQIKVWDLNSYVQVDNLVGHNNQVKTLAPSPDGKHIAVSTDAPYVHIWDIEHETFDIVDAELETWGREAIWHQSSGSLVIAHKQHILVSNIRGNIHTRLPETSTDRGHTEFLWALAFSPDEHWLVSSGEDRKLIFWDMTTGRPIHIIEGFDRWLARMVFSVDGEYLATSDWTPQVLIWHVPTLLNGDYDHALYRRYTCFDDLVTQFAFTDNDSLITVQGRNDGELLEFFFKTEEEEPGVIPLPFKIQSELTPHTFSPLGDYFAVSTAGNIIHIINLHDSTHVQLTPSEDDKHNSPVSRIKFVPNPASSMPLVATGNTDGKVIIWDVENGKSLHVLEPIKLYQNLNIRGTGGLTLGERFLLSKLGATND